MSFFDTLAYPFAYILYVLFVLVSAPLLPGIIDCVRAFAAGRRGPSLLQPYRDYYVWVHKHSLWSESGSFITQITPYAVLLCAVLSVLFISPSPRIPALFAFPCDFVFLFGLLGVMRLMTALAALDSGGSLQSAASSRELALSFIAEPLFFTCIMSMAVLTHTNSLSDMAYALLEKGEPLRITHLLVIIALFIILMFESKRVPFDAAHGRDQGAMIQQGFLREYSAASLAMMQYAAVLKMWLFASLIGVMCMSFTQNAVVSLIFQALFPFAVALLLGVIESITARIRLRYLPRLLFVAAAFAVIAFIFACASNSGGGSC